MEWAACRRREDRSMLEIERGLEGAMGSRKEVSKRAIAIPTLG